MKLKRVGVSWPFVSANLKLLSAKFQQEVSNLFWKPYFLKFEIKLIEIPDILIADL